MRIVLLESHVQDRPVLERVMLDVTSFGSPVRQFVTAPGRTRWEHGYLVLVGISTDPRRLPFLPLVPQPDIFHKVEFERMTPERQDVIRLLYQYMIDEDEISQEGLDELLECLRLGTSFIGEDDDD